MEVVQMSRSCAFNRSMTAGVGRARSGSGRMLVSRRNCSGTRKVQVARGSVCEGRRSTGGLVTRESGTGVDVDAKKRLRVVEVGGGAVGEHGVPKARTVAEQSLVLVVAHEHGHGSSA